MTEPLFTGREVEAITRMALAEQSEQLHYKYNVALQQNMQCQLNTFLDYVKSLDTNSYFDTYIS